MIINIKELKSIKKKKWKYIRLFKKKLFLKYLNRKKLVKKKNYTKY